MIKILKLLFLCLFIGSVNAKPLYLKITGTSDISTNIAIAIDDQKIAQIVSHDLQNSGQFTIVKLPDGFSKNDKEWNFAYLRQERIDYLVIGESNTTNNDKAVKIRLLDVYKPFEPLRFSKNITTSKENIRELSHRISDLVFESITGIKGFFRTKIAYIAVAEKQGVMQHSLVVSDLDGHNDKNLFTVPYPVMSPSWSPNGEYIAFVSFKDNRAAIRIADVISGEVALISKFPGINGAPAWSPDGRKLALVLSKDGSPKIYVLELSNKKLTRITKGGSIDTEPCWAKDGKSIIFTSNRGGKPQIYQVALSDNKVKRLTFKGDYNTTPSLTPDGKHMVVLHCAANCNKRIGKFFVALQTLATGRVKVLTKYGQEDSPVIAPNGMMVLYGTKGKAYNSILGGVSIDGRFNIQLPMKDAGVKDPAWSPFVS